ncbi:MAG: Ig-like domain-containing protein [Ferruginibacter sp.]
MKRRQGTIAHFVRMKNRVLYNKTINCDLMIKTAFFPGRPVFNGLPLLFFFLLVFVKNDLNAQTPCNQRVIDEIDFKYTGAAPAPARWSANDIYKGGFLIDQAAFAYVPTGNFSNVNTNFANTNAGNNTTRQYAVTANPNTLSPQYANIPTDGMLVINPLQGNTDQYLTYTIAGLVPGNVYNIEIKVWNVLDMAMPGSCQSWCNWNDQLYIDMANNQPGAEHANQNNQNWNGTNGNGGWSQGTNQVDRILKLAPGGGGAFAVITGTMTMPNAGNTLTIKLAKGNSSNPVVLGVDYIKIFGCQAEAINVSGGSTSVCEATELTLTAQGLGSIGSVYKWYKDGQLIPGSTKDTINVITPIGPGTSVVYKAEGIWSSKDVTLTSKLCCSSTGGTSDEVIRQSFNGLTYTCANGRSGGYADIPDKGTKNFIDAAYLYAGATCNSLNDGQYAVVQSSFAGDYWRNRPEVKDHTGLANSGALFINAAGPIGQVFYKFDLTQDLCKGTTYEFSVWYASLAGPGEIKPKIEFNVMDGNTKIASVNTGVIPIDEHWYQATVTFFTPATGTTPVYTLQVVNLVSGSSGNDLMLDDIVVKKCTPFINLYQDGTKDTAVSVCSTTPVNLKVTTYYDLPLAITLSSTGTVYYQWMSSTSPNGPWTLIGTPVTTGTFAATPTSTPTYYRAKVSADATRAANGIPPVAKDCGNDGITTSFKLSQSGNFTVPPVTGTLAYCAGDQLKLTGDPGTGDQWEWRKGATYNAATVIPGYQFSNDNAKKEFIKTAAAADAGNYYFVSQQASGCTGYATAAVTVNPIPTISGKDSVCVGNTITLSGSGTPATTGAWVSASPAIATVDATGKVTGVTAGNAKITFKNSGGCIKDTTIKVSAKPTVTGTPNVCVNGSVKLSSTDAPAASNPWVSADATVATVDATGNVTGKKAGTVKITFTNNNGCSVDFTVTVNDNPTVTSNTNSVKVCMASTITLTGSPTAAASNAWISADPTVATISNAGAVAPLKAGNTKITYTNSNGCTKDTVITVNDLPTINNTINGSASLSTGSILQLTGSGTAATSNAWVSADPSVATVSATGQVKGIKEGTTTITYTNSNGCSSKITITVSDLPVISGDLTVCIGSESQLTGTGTAAAANPWTSSNPGVATVNTTGLVTGITVGSTNITYTDNNGKSVDTLLTVNGKPFITGASAKVCNGNTIQLNGTGTAAAANAWVSADPSKATVDATGLVKGIAGGNVGITYTDNNGCTKDTTITVNDLPVISTTGSTTICQNATVQLSGLPAAAASNAWVSADVTKATVDAGGLVKGIAAGTVAVTYTDVNGCKKDQNIVVNGLPSVPTANNAARCGTGTVNLSVTATATDVIKWYSDAALTTQLTTPTPTTYTTPSISATTNYYVTATSPDGCVSASATTVTATVNPGPNAPTGIGDKRCGPGSVTLTATINGNATDVVKWYSDQNLATLVFTGLSFQTPSLSDTTDYYIVEENAAGCASTPVKVTALINAVPLAPSVINAGICGTGSVSLNAAASFTGSTLTWYSDQALTTAVGTLAVFNTPVITATTNYYVNETTAAGCAGPAATATATINEVPVSSFTATADCANKSVTFTNIGTASISEWTWNFDDGSGVHVKNNASSFDWPYPAGGTHTVTLEVKTAAGCTNTAPFSQIIVFGAIPVADFTIGDLCLADKTATFTNTSSISDGTLMSYTWEFGDNSIPENIPPAAPAQRPYTYATSGTYIVKLTATSSGGCVDTTAKQVIIVSIPVAADSVRNSSSLCSNQEVKVVNITAASGQGSVSKIDVFWQYPDLGNKTSDNQPAPGSEYGNRYPEFGTPLTKTYTILVRAYNANGCFDDSLQTITINASPKLQLTPLANICLSAAPLDVSLSATDIFGLGGTVSVQGNGVNGNIFSPATAGVGTHKLNYTIATSNGCTSTGEQDITVTALPVNNFKSSYAVMENESLKILPVTPMNPGLTYQWSPATYLDNPASATPTVSNAAADITYSLRLTAADNCSLDTTVQVVVLSDFVVTNTFTPNNDGYHDRWVLSKLSKYPNHRVQVFNRSGQLVYETRNFPPDGWDGTYKGKVLPFGTYYYIIELGGVQYPKKGYITIIK